jgi:hypothetical protein
LSDEKSLHQRVLAFAHKLSNEATEMQKPIYVGTPEYARFKTLVKVSTELKQMLGESFVSQQDDQMPANDAWCSLCARHMKPVGNRNGG